MTNLAFALAATIKHDGHGGVADLLSTPEQASAWLAAQSADLGRFLPPSRAENLPNPDEMLRELVRMRRAVRALFARAVAPGAPSKADADQLMGVDEALTVVNAAAARLGTAELVWDEEPSSRWAYATEDPVNLLGGAVGRSVIEFMVGPDRQRLRACPAARCVKYFLQDDPRQTWCSPTCGNRERVNRHYRKRTGG
ncbi:CGNR zinc finger domain-containing protein [Kribbella sp. NPDC004536]|uniref:CGNR zinc finger domain-containing protein n=1 Tax=Kribbella sp. NPDC004536 TaxID=3364106 RepID=UPI0036C86700